MQPHFVVFIIRYCVNTSTESSDTQLFGAGKFKGVALLGGLHAHLPQNDIEKKSKFKGAKSGRNFFFNRANFILILLAKYMHISF